MVSSDGSLGIPKAISNHFPQAQQQRCITHKVRGIERHLNYAGLPTVNEQGQPWKPIEAKQQRRFEIIKDAYAIYEVLFLTKASTLLNAFELKWQILEHRHISTAWAGFTQQQHL